MVYFIATPIGNLKDISMRAVEVMKNCDAIFCEDTRHSQILLSAYDIKKPLFSCHKFNERESAQKIVSLAKEGKEIAVISDAGTPVISDPGNILCKVLREEEIAYTIIPGACAAISALVLSAFDAERFAFIGFLRGNNSDKKELLSKYALSDLTLIFYSAPQDVNDDIKALFEVFGNRKAAAVREITKIHEEVQYFNLESSLGGEKRGEYVLVVEGNKENVNPLNKLSIEEHIEYYIAQGYDKKEALKKVAKDRKVTKSEIYKYTIE
jgi:16S rRNA (cytidine1402-2'-O)-methyltransferase